MPVVLNRFTTPLMTTRMIAIGARMTAPRRIPWTVFFTCVTNSPPGPIPELSTIRWSGGMSTPVIIIATTVYSADVITVYWAIPRR